MANSGTAYFDSKGQFFRTPEEATSSDLASLLGRVGEGESLAPGIAKILLERRRDIEQIFRDHDEMVQSRPAGTEMAAVWPFSSENGKVTAIRPAG